MWDPAYPKSGSHQGGSGLDASLSHAISAAVASGVAGRIAPEQAAVGCTEVAEPAVVAGGIAAVADTDPADTAAAGWRSVDTAVAVGGWELADTAAVAADMWSAHTAAAAEQAPRRVSICRTDSLAFPTEPGQID